MCCCCCCCCCCCWCCCCCCVAVVLYQRYYRMRILSLSLVYISIFNHSLAHSLTHYPMFFSSLSFLTNQLPITTSNNLTTSDNSNNNGRRLYRSRSRIRCRCRRCRWKWIESRHGIERSRIQDGLCHKIVPYEISYCCGSRWNQCCIGWVEYSRIEFSRIEFSSRSWVILSRVE